MLAVTRSDSDFGPASQDVACARAGEITSASPAAAFVGVAMSKMRSNLVLVNEGPDTTVDLRMLPKAAPSEVAFRSIAAAGEIRQLDSFARLFAPGPQALVQSGALLVIPAPGGEVLASVARIDNRTNDPVGIAPVPIPRTATLL